MRHDLTKRLLVLAVAAAFAAGGCGVPTQDSPKLAEDSSVPFGLLNTDAPGLAPSVTTQLTEPVSLCFVRNDRLAIIERALNAPASPTDIVDALTEAPATAAGVRTAIGSPPIVAGVALHGGVLEVDLAESVATLGGTDQLLAIAQLVCTFTARAGIGQVAFTLGGAPVDVPRGDGALTANPVSRDDYAVLLP